MILTMVTIVKYDARAAPETKKVVDLTSIRRMCSEIGIPLVTRQVYDITHRTPPMSYTYNYYNTFVSQKLIEKND